MLFLVFTGGRGDKKDLIDPLLELTEVQRTVIQGAWQAEAIIHERHLPASVSVEHGADLRDSHMRLVHDDQKIILKIVNQRIRRLAFHPAREMSRIVLDARAEAGLLHHLDIELGALADPLRFQELVIFFEPGYPVPHLSLDGIAGGAHLFRRNDIEGSRVDRLIAELRPDLSGQRIDLGHTFDLITEKFDADREFIVVRGNDLERIALHTKSPAVEIHLIPLVLHIDELTDQIVTVLLHARAHGCHHVREVFRRADTVNTGYGRHYDDIPPL